MDENLNNNDILDFNYIDYNNNLENKDEKEKFEYINFLFDENLNNNDILHFNYIDYNNNLEDENEKFKYDN